MWNNEIIINGTYIFIEFVHESGQKYYPVL